ncbi:MAG TPA: flippase [Solirubrobacteraceae bacterium]|nr:flippase [Solirubrobacteraceae bacterium]
MTELTVAVSRRRLTLATAAQIGGRVIGAVLGVVVAATLARSLTRGEFGELSLALSITTLAGTLGDLGMRQVAVREMSRAPERRAAIAGALLTAQFVLGVVLAVIGVAIAFALMSGHQARLMAVFVMATMPVGAVGALAVSYQARLRPELVLVPTLIQNVVWLGIVLVLAATNAGLVLYGVGALAAAILQSAITAGLALRLTEVSFVRIGGLIGELLRLAWPIGLAGVFVTAYYRIDGVLLFHYRGAVANAYYSAAYRVIDVLQIFPATIGSVLLPLLASAEREPGGEARARRVFELAIILLVAIAVPVAVLGGILAPGVVALVYGHAYHRSVLLLQILLPSFIFISVSYVLIGQLVLRGMLRPYIVAAFLGAVLNVVVNLIGIPTGGAVVAAWATVGTEAIVMAAIAVVVHRRLGYTLPYTRILRCLVATALTAVVVWLVRHQPLALGLLVAAVVYPPVVLGVRAITIGELRSLLSRDAAARA